MKDRRPERKRYYIKHKEEIDKKNKKYYITHKDERLAYARKYRDEHSDALNIWFKKYQKTPRRQKYDRERCRIRNTVVKLKILTHYGNGIPACVLCGHNHITSLSIDHIDGNGKSHRESLGRKSHMTGMTFYWWLVRNNFPEGFRTLCMNCQFDERERLRAGAPLRKTS